MTQEQFEMELEERRQQERSEMDEYNRKQYEHECYMEQKKPVPPPLYFTHYKPTPDYPTHAETAIEATRIYKLAMDEWSKEFHMDAPNKPGYYRANND